MKALFVYPNLSMMLTPSVAIGLFTRILRGVGWDVDIFDSTHYLTEENSSPMNRVRYLQARPFSPADCHWEMREDLYGDFVKKVDAFQPDLILVSIVEDTITQARALLRMVADRGIPTVVGGVFCTAAPEKAISIPEFPAIVLGEGEDVVRRIAYRMEDGRFPHGIPGLWVRWGDGEAARPARGPLAQIGSVWPDYSLFDEARFYRPMGGKVFKTLPLETYRGCPHTCAYCNSPMQNEQAKVANIGNFLRRKPMDVLEREIAFLVERYQPELFYIIDDSFLARPDLEVQAFCAMYERFGLPFWFNTRPENCTSERLKMLKGVGCYRISAGVECGNERFRRDVLLRNVRNEKLLKHLGYMTESGIPFSVNAVIGFPYETRELIFETIELLRQAQGYDTLTVSIFTPYHGTVLREVAIQAGFLDPDAMTTHTTATSMLRMPQLTAEAIDGLMRTLTMYVEFPKSRWPEIERAETDDAVHATLAEEFRATYFRATADGEVVG